MSEILHSNIKKFILIVALISATFLFYVIYLKNSVNNSYEKLENPLNDDENIFLLEKNDALLYDLESLDSIDLSCEYLSKVRTAVIKAKSDIYEFWDVSNFPIFLESMHIPKQSWLIQKAKFMKLILKNKLAESFVIGFSGSSVTAGHDNYFYEAYPQIFFNAINPVFESMNKKLIVRNHAIGNNPCLPYDACIGTHIGEDVDIITWEQSMNCGRDAKPVDVFFRQANKLPKKPTVMFLLSGSPSWSPEICQQLYNSTDYIARRKPLSSHEKNLLKSSLSSTVDQTNLMSTMRFLSDSKGPPLYEKFQFMAPMAQKSLVISEYQCLGPYNANFSLKTLGKGASWHPGRLTHKFRGDNLAFHLLSIFEEALDDAIKLFSRYQDKSCNIKLTKDTAVSSRLLRNLRSSKAKAKNNLLSIRSQHVEKDLISSPQLRHLIDSNLQNVKGNNDQQLIHIYNALHTENYENSDLESKLSKLATNSKNSYCCNLSISKIQYLYAHSYVNKFSIHALPPIPKFYHLDEVNQKAHCYTNYEPRVHASLDEIVLQRFSNWSLELSPFDKKAVAKSIEHGMGYLDRKMIFLSQGKGSSLFLEIKTKSTNPIWFCELQKGFLSYPSYMSDLNAGALVFIKENFQSDMAISKSNFDSIKMKAVELNYLSDQCYRSVESFPPSNYLIKLEQREEKTKFVKEMQDRKESIVDPDILILFKKLVAQNVAVPVAAMNALITKIKESEATTWMQLELELSRCIESLKSLSREDLGGRTHISLGSGCELFMKYVTRSFKLENKDFRDCKDDLLRRGEKFAGMSMSSRSFIAEIGESFIQEDSTILIHGISRVVSALILKAAETKKFNIIATESRPDSSSIERVNSFARAGIPTKIINDSAVGIFMEQVDMCLVGAEGVMENGGIVNKVGTYQIALVAHALQRPFYVAVESYKFARMYPLTQKDITERTNNPQSVVDKNFEKLPDNLHSNMSFDLPIIDFTPAKLITLLFTDLGVLTPAAVSDELIKLYQ